MKSRIGKFCLLLLASMMLTTTVNAQWRRPLKQRQRKPVPQISQLGVRVGNDFKNDAFMLGGQLWLPASRLWKIAPSFEYFYVDKMSKWQFNGDLIFKPRPRGFFYLGGGLAVDYTTPQGRESTTAYGGNAFLGIDFSGGRRFKSMAPYLQARWTFFEGTRYFGLLGGINFALR